jgi:serpin B
MDNWVNQKTFGLINSIGFQPDATTEMVLANALAIQMKWRHQFDASDTGGNTFYAADGSEYLATTMQLETLADDIKYYVDDDVTAISMPLNSTSEDTSLDFIAIMPSSELDSYIETVEQSDLESIIENFKPASTPADGLIINIPKFKFSYKLNFGEDLQALGIKTAFDSEAADFSNMASIPLFVSKAAHEANIDFSEEGIKAAAITVFAMDVSAMVPAQPQQIIINIDHPFLFLIRDANNGTIWFTGAVYKPNLWADDQDDYQRTY